MIIDLPTRSKREPSEICQTPTLRRICEMIEDCRVDGDMGLLLGVPGVGKTTAIRHYLETPVIDASGSTQNFSCKMFLTASEVMGANTQVFANALWGAWEGSVSYFTRYGSAHQALDQVVRHLTDLFIPVVIIIDEAQKLNSKNIEVLREIHDQTGVGIVISANPAFQNRWNKSQRASFAQLESRLTYRIILNNAVAKNDVYAICAEWGVADQKVIDALVKHSDTVGGLRRVVKLLKRATRFAQGKPLTVGNVNDAALYMGIGR